MLWPERVQVSLLDTMLAKEAKTMVHFVVENSFLKSAETVIPGALWAEV